jgi:hypothetical protein
MEKKVFLNNFLIVFVGIIIVFLLQKYTSIIPSIRIFGEPLFLFGTPSFMGFQWGVFGGVNWLVILTIAIIGITFGPVKGAIIGFSGLLLALLFSLPQIISWNIRLSSLYILLLSLPYGLYGYLIGYFHKKISANIKGIVFALLIQSILYFILIVILTSIYPYFYRISEFRNQNMNIFTFIFHRSLNEHWWKSHYINYYYPIIITFGMVYFFSYKKFTNIVNTKISENIVFPGKKILKTSGIIGIILSGFFIIMSTLTFFTTEPRELFRYGLRLYYLFPILTTFFLMFTSISAVANCKNLFKAEFIQTLATIGIVLSIGDITVAINEYGLENITFFALPFSIILYILLIIGATKNKNIIQSNTSEIIEILRDISFIGLILFPLLILCYIGYNYLGTESIITLTIFGFGLLYTQAIVALVNGIKYKIKLLKVMSIIGIILYLICEINIFILIVNREFYNAFYMGIISLIYAISYSIILFVKSKRKIKQLQII